MKNKGIVKTSATYSALVTALVVMYSLYQLLNDTPVPDVAEVSVRLVTTGIGTFLSLFFIFALHQHFKTRS